MNRLAAAGAPPSAVVGVRRALERGQGRNAVPVGTALIGTILAVLALSATAVFGESLRPPDGVTGPVRPGLRRLLLAGLPTDVKSLTTLLAQLKADPAITGITLGASSEISHQPPTASTRSPGRRSGARSS